MNFFERTFLIHSLRILLLISASSMAVAAESDKETKEDIAKHRIIATAHEAAAKCREAGKGEAACNKELQNACKSVAIGKFCGMKHAH